jgi:hemoglobin
MTSVYDAAGGAEAFQVLAAAHHQRCLDDEVLNHPFSHPGHPQHVQRLGWYWAEVFGGPPLFTERCGDHSRVLAMHAGTGAQADMGERFLACFVGAMDDAGLPQEPRLRSTMRAYMQWATDQVQAISPEGSVVEELVPVPHWSWDGLQT